MAESLGWPWPGVASKPSRKSPMLHQGAPGARESAKPSGAAKAAQVKFRPRIRWEKGSIPPPPMTQRCETAQAGT